MIPHVSIPLIGHGKCRRQLLLLLFLIGARASAQTLNVQLGNFALPQNSCASVQAADPFPTPTEPYKRRYNTIAHKFLDEEVAVGGVTSSMYAILDDLIDEAKSSLIAYTPDGLSPSARRDFAVDTLKKIDCILVRHAFVYPGRGEVELLSDGLDPTVYPENSTDREQLRSQPHNRRRLELSVNKPGDGPFYVVDCDIASFIYLAIAEVMKYPLYLVEIPNHNFVRWDIGAGAYVDFETMDGVEESDEYYKNMDAIPSAFVGRGGILKSMGEKQDFSYHDVTVSVALGWRQRYAEMINELLKAISTDSENVDALYSLAGFYTTVPDEKFRDGKKAIAYAKRAVALRGDSDDYDALACGYAQEGDFTVAIEEEFAASAAGYVTDQSGIDEDIASFRKKPPESCKDASFDQDPMPFRPSNPAIPRVGLQYKLMRRLSN